MQNKLIKILREESGASFVFVLGIMLPLIIIGVSVLTAAGANAGFALKQKEHSRISLLHDSVHKNILYSLQNGAGDNDYLYSQLVMLLYEAKDSGGTLADMENIRVSLNGAVSDAAEFSLSFTRQEVYIADAVPEIPAEAPVYDGESGELLSEGSPGFPRVPKTASVDALMTATVTITSNGKISESTAYYEYSGGYLDDDRIPGVMEFTDYGKWELIKYE